MDLIEPLIAFIIIFTLIACVEWGPTIIRDVWRWLRGSRRSYVLQDRKIIELEPNISYRGSILVPVIEIRKFLWWYRGKVRGLAGCSWRISKICKRNDSYDIWLNWQRCEDLGSALRLVNEYRDSFSLHKILDQIAELEKELSETRESFSDLHADVESVIRAVKDNKQRYRAPAAQRIQHCLEEVCLHSKAPKPDQTRVNYGAAIFKERLKLL